MYNYLSQSLRNENWQGVLKINNTNECIKIFMEPFN